MIPIKILVASDSYKGSLSSLDVIRAVREAAGRLGIGLEVIGVPVGDGGEGTLDALIASGCCRRVDAAASDPLGRKIAAYFGLRGSTAVVELAVASGLTRLQPDERNPWLTSTYGTGELIRQALELPGVSEVIVTIGGSATNDGGLGLAQALGLRALDQHGHDLPPGGGGLRCLRRLDSGAMHERLTRIKVTVACDVSNTLCGEMGASLVYGPQKGATLKMAADLDRSLYHLATIIKRDLGVDVLGLPGGGAAGGAGAGLVAFCDARLLPGSDLILDLLGFEQSLQDADLVITGEGLTDSQTVSGKAPLGVARRARRLGKPVICLSGALGTGYKELYREGFDALFSICPGPATERQCLDHAYGHLVDTAEDLLRFFVSCRQDRPV